MNKYIILLSLTVFHFNLYAQKLFIDIKDEAIEYNTPRYIIPNSYKTFELNNGELEQKLLQAKLESDVKVRDSKLIIHLPTPTGEKIGFRFVESPVMSPILSSKFPSIKTYLGESMDGTITVRFDYSPKYGFHAMIRGVSESIFIDPYSFQNKKHIISYYKKDYTNHSKQNFKEEKPISSIEYQKHLEYKNQNPASIQQRSSGDQLRTYRTAIACTQQYSNFHGGTTEGTLAAMVTTMNRINGVFETEVAIRLILVDNNDDLIEYSVNAGMSNNNTGTLLNQSQDVIDDVIGNENYDLGHTFSTGAGGLASLGVPCRTGEKASGVTGTNSPVGDPFDIDYVAHELGHQFGANHTFNGSSGSCGGGNRNEETAYEPGSATTIMGYAGLCSNHNIQSNSDPYFHAISFDEISYLTKNGYGNTCASITETGNTIPEVILEEVIHKIPVYTAFEIEGQGTDADGDILTYSWEQMDLGPSGHPNYPSNNAPIFRAFSPSESPLRVFPRMYDILNNTQTKGELIPEYARTLNFRLTVRDNRAGGGGLAFAETQVEVTEQAGPFEVIYPNGNETWGINTNYPVTWQVEDTDDGAVNSPYVNIILLHNTNGNWEETILAENEENDGEAEVSIPNIDELIGSQNRIKIKPTNNIFFDISNDDFAITAMSISEISQGKVEIYPNPSNSEFNIRMTNLGKNNLGLIVLDISGKIIHQETIDTSSGNFTHKMHLKNVSKGTYFLKLSTDKEQAIQIISIL